MKNIFVGLAIIVALGGYVWWSMNNAAAPAIGTTSAPSETLNPAGTSSETATAAGSGNPPTATSGYKNGSYTGTVVDSVYGPVQVAITIVGGKIATLTVPQYPNSRGHTSEVSSYSIPLLTQEAIAAQSANVDIVSGATQTAEAFKESLASALSQAA